MSFHLVLLAVITVTVSVDVVISFEAHDVICQRLPNNPNCPGARRAPSSNDQPLPSQTPTQPQLPSQAQPQTQPQPQAAPTAQDYIKACQSLKDQYNAHCVSSGTLPADVQAYCDLYVERCVTPGYSQAAPQAAGFSSGSQGQPYPPKRPFGTKWSQLTNQGYQKEQLQQVDYSQRFLYDCATYSLPYNTLCYPNVSNFICNELRRICLTHAEDVAAGQAPVNGPFAYNNGLPTGGAGSSRPLTWGNNMGLGPFFNMGANQAINPLQGYGQSSQMQVPIVGLGSTISKGVDYGGLIGVSQLGQLLDGRRRRRMITLSDIIMRKNRNSYKI